MRILKGLLLVVIVSGLLVVYIMWDNYRVIVVKEEVVVSDLNEELTEFKILQITDLHERVFGKDQKWLLKKINSLSYDVLVFTGDMINDQSTNYEPFYSLLEGIDNKEHLLYVPGNTDSDAYEVSPHFGKNDYIIELEKRGVKLLESMYTVEKAGKAIHFVNFELAIVKKPEQIGKINGTFQSVHASNEDYQTYQKKLWKEMNESEVLNSTGPLIALNHYPVPDQRIDYIENDPNTEWQDFNLIIAGHYHGGQFRIPFYGALFIPDPWYEPNSLFPPQDRVKGLWQYEQTKQYVSTGLGSSDAISFLNFRLFNTPEINLITLKSE